MQNRTANKAVMDLANVNDKAKKANKDADFNTFKEKAEKKKKEGEKKVRGRRPGLQGGTKDVRNLK